MQREGGCRREEHLHLRCLGVLACYRPNVDACQHSQLCPWHGLVSGDTFGLTITGAAAKSAVTVTATRDGVSTTPTPWYAGSTDESGNFSLTGTETDDYVAEYTTVVCRRPTDRLTA